MRYRRFIADTRVLQLHDAEGKWLYEVDLERCRTAAEVADWIFQVEGKSWATDSMPIGASSVTLVPSTVRGAGEGHGEGAITQVVATTPSTPPASFWGIATTDGVEYLVRIDRMS